MITEEDKRYQPKLIFRSTRIDNLNLFVLPKYLQYILENLFVFVFTVVKQQTGKKGFIYFPIVFCVFFIIVTLNYLSLVPFGQAPTSNIIITFFYAGSLCLAIVFIGLIEQNFKFFSHFVPECPIMLLPLLIVIEIFSYLLRSFSLAIRLSANILAGHTLVYIIASAILVMVTYKYMLFVLGLGILFPILGLEFAIAFLQGYVFITLFCIYLSEALGPNNFDFMYFRLFVFLKKIQSYISLQTQQLNEKHQILEKTVNYLERN